MNPTMAGQESEILSRVVGPEEASVTPEVPRSILEFRFSDTNIAVYAHDSDGVIIVNPFSVPSP